MDATPRSSQEEPVSFISDSGAEMARLIEQDRLYTKAMGGWFSEQGDNAHFQRVLDIACGPGGWALELAQAHSDIEVVGFDISPEMVAYANSQAQASHLSNATFRVMDALEPLDFPEEHFDLVNGRYLAIVPTLKWPTFLQELLRITRPGGIIRITENDMFSLTNSPAVQKMSGMIGQASKRAGFGFSPDGRDAGLTPVIGHLLRAAGCQQVKRKATVIDWSSDTDDHRLLYHDFTAFLKLVQPFLTAMGVTTGDEVEQIYQDALREMGSADFCGIVFLLTVWGEKPHDSIITMK